MDISIALTNKPSDLARLPEEATANFCETHDCTPGEFHETLLSALARIRARMKEKGHDVPDSDVELARMVKESIEEDRKVKAASRKVWETVQKEIWKSTPNWAVCLDGGHAVEFFEEFQDAVDSQAGRNAKAAKMGISARYIVVDKDLAWQMREALLDG